MSVKRITVNIDGTQLMVPEGTTVLGAAKQAGIKIPTLCYLKGVQAIGACRICLIEVEKMRGLQAACVFPLEEGMVIHTHTQKVLEARRFSLELILANHPMECLTCSRNLNCELQTLAHDLGVMDTPYEVTKNPRDIDESNPSIVRDSAKCIHCQRCVNVCKKVQNVSALGMSQRGFATRVVPTCDERLGDIACTFCGQCALACPVAAITERDDTQHVWSALSDPSKHVVVQTAPSVRVALGEEFGLEPGHSVTGKMVAALRRLGFQQVFDTNFGADLTIMEEGHEFLSRLKAGGPLPMITSCSPGWVKYIEHFYPDLLDHLSTCKSPHQMLGAIIKSYYAEKKQLDPRNIFTVSVMPCTAKKFERQRPEMHEDVDAVITTRELARMIKQAGIDFLALSDEEFDLPLGMASGAGLIFGATGGVMEAALRTLFELVNHQDLGKLDFEAIRGFTGIKEAQIKLGEQTIKVAAAHGLANAHKLMELIKSGQADYQFIEIMGCPGGCLGGGGQPIPTNAEIRQKRAEALYQEDKELPIRKSHKNPAVQELYRDYLGEPNGEKAHHLLHTHYTRRNKW